jgi:hypothetical protein
MKLLAITVSTAWHESCARKNTWVSGRLQQEKNEQPRAKRKEIRPLGGIARRRRRYWLDVAGRQGWRARYVKDVDASETTLRFWQEIFDENGKLTEIHEKYPVDKGHQKA